MGIKCEVRRPTGVILSSVKSSFGEDAVCLYLGGSTFLNRVPKIVSLYGGA